MKLFSKKSVRFKYQQPHKSLRNVSKRSVRQKKVSSSPALKPPIKVTLGRLAAVAAVAGTAWTAVHVYQYATTDPRFAIKKIEVKGAARLSQEDILRWSGLHAGPNIFKLSMGEAEERLMRRGVFAKVSASRRLPDTIYVAVKEREPLVSIGNFQVDPDGVVSPRIVSPKPGGFPVSLEGSEFKGLEIGKTTDDDRILVGLAVAKALRRQGDILVQCIVVEDALNPCLTLMNGIEVKLGSQRFEEKLERIHEVLGALEVKKKLPRVIDLRYRDEAAVTFK